MLDLLVEADRSVNTIAGHFQLSRPAVSQHLRVLLDAGLVSERRQGRERRYRLVPRAARSGARLAGTVRAISQDQTHEIMNQGTQRSIVRWIHLLFSIPIFGYIYSPFENIPEYAPATRFVFLPALALTGLWMWKGHVIRSLIAKSS